MPDPVGSPGELTISTTDGVLLAGEQVGEGMPVVLLHGLTATRRYVVMGSRLLERSGFRVISYDARAHGRSSPAPDPRAYTYERLAGDLLTVLDTLNVKRAVLAGASMGAHTIVRFALDHPERVVAAALITPAYDPDVDLCDPAATASWDALARGLREGGVEGFLAAYDLDALPPRWQDTVARVLSQRLSAHVHPLALADALEAVPRSRAFERWEDLARIEAPVLVIASRDEADPGHPLAVAERYARAIPGARLEVEPPEEPPRSPIAWQGGQISRLIAALACP
ncbi:MAG TPA: alpha/beta hydrolase [Solirubrobacteraceae bacterium]|nr:alpha/beta hydrolase [Solirubrobacteraceae bacterium]